MTKTRSFFFPQTLELLTDGSSRFIGLTPGVLVTIATVNWLRGVFGGKKILKRGKMQKLIRGTLR